MQTLGKITLNISFLIYLIQFVPQIIHNFREKHALNNISLLTQFGMLIVVLCNLIQAIGFNLNWQYLTIVVVYLIGITIQQIQISFNNKHQSKNLNIIFVMLFFITILAISSKSYFIFEAAGTISLIVHFLYWLPQIYKNYKQQIFVGYGDLFIIFAWLGVICDLCSSFLLNWPIIVKTNIIAMFVIISILALQKLYYHKNSRR
ncbi:hypothetical protein LO80_04540 [Candidatus Francisella endociliophora]|uniref:PQ loop repeat family protein n=1 Tax=Candidatus Francisella endociliophora TaxID=653937 RepID=A0A097EP14_9GAMM|nr:PQ-loop repeat-containing protein [Francisella sp. FSC1006]AIT09307.1 hypothetical protein LO80_04540 [Francisella sp. FSC1006]